MSKSIEKCECSDPNCERKIQYTDSLLGVRIKVLNHFSCKQVQDTIKKGQLIMSKYIKK